MLSVYIPVYNCAQFLPRLIRSLSDLPANKVELVFVDDGSQDESAVLLNEFAAKRSNTIVSIRPVNGGVGCAVNDALRLSHGKWVQRCDADDEVIAEGVMAAYELAVNRDYDLVMQPFYRIERDGYVRFKEPEPILVNETPLQRFWRKGSPTTCCCMVRRRILQDNNIRVPLNLIVGEDRVWLLNYVAYLSRDRVGLSNIPAYRYHIRSGSISHQQRIVKARLNLVLLDAMLVLGEQFVYSKDLEWDYMVEHLMDGTAASAVRELVRARQYGQALAEYQRLKLRFGSVFTRSVRMRKQFWRALPFGFWSLFWP
jgi:glycosyltransferase involved in cell wall biosynthesis